jgi:hypothetical protein
MSQTKKYAKTPTRVAAAATQTSTIVHATTKASKG